MTEAKTLFEKTLEAARVERERVARGKDLISRDDCPPETNPMGIMRWYLHPALEEPSTRALYFHELEIPMGSRSGLLRCQGGIIHFVLEGSGYTEVNGEEHEWESGDVIAIPIMEAGVVYRHVNTGLGPVRMLVAWPNYDSANGPEGGVHMDVLEPAPEYQALAVSAGQEPTGKG